MHRGTVPRPAGAGKWGCLGDFARSRAGPGGHAVYVACSTLSFSKLSLEDALRTIREMHFTKADLAVHAAGPHLTPADVAADPGWIAQRLKAANLPLAAIHVDTGQVTTDDARNLLRAVARLARVSTTPVLTIPPAAMGADFDAEVSRLSEWVKIVSAEGVILTVETLSTAVTADPLGAVELCRRIPGLGITLDPTYYQIGPHGAINYDAVFPFVKHVRLRDSGSAPEKFQLRIGQGDIEYGRIIAQLERCRYDRALTVDIRDIPDSPFPIEPEVRKLKYLLESLV
jgi:sugar phosphate isomerase/epimerase